MSVSDAFRDYVLEQLGGLRSVTWRRMFGGIGVYAGGAFFGVLDDDQLFLRVDEGTRPSYEAAGSRPFAPIPGEKPMMGYFEVPAAVLDDRLELEVWAARAVAVAHAAAAHRARKVKAERSPAERQARRGASRERMRVSTRVGATAGRVSAATILKPFPPRVRALANRLRAVVRRAVPVLREVPYPGWRAVGFQHPDAGYVCGVFPSPEGARLIFEHGGTLDDPDGILEGKGRVKQVRYVTLRAARDVRARALTRLVRAAVAHRLTGA